MIKFSFQRKIPSFFSEKITWRYDTIERMVNAKRNFWGYDTELNFSIDIVKGTTRVIEDNNIYKTTFNGQLDQKEVLIESTNLDIIIHYEGNTYDFIFQKGLITGIFINNQNVGIVKQKAWTTFGMVKFYGIVSTDVPEYILCLFILLFHRKYNDMEGYIWYRYSGFTSISPEPRPCDDALLAKVAAMQPPTL